MELPRPPVWRWEWDINTVVLIISIIGGGAVTWTNMEKGREANAAGMARLEVRVDKLETAARLLDNHELRLAAVETQMISTAAGVRGVEMSISQLSSDIRVVREILQRLEQRSSGHNPLNTSP